MLPTYEELSRDFSSALCGINGVYVETDEIFTDEKRAPELIEVSGTAPDGSRFTAFVQINSIQIGY
jgi:hypothetical protein